jgi:hypothetical protein
LSFRPSWQPQLHRELTGRAQSTCMHAHDGQPGLPAHRSTATQPLSASAFRPSRSSEEISK